MNVEAMEAMMLDAPHEMRFTNAATGYLIRYECEHCGDNEVYDCGPDIEAIPSYAQAKDTYPLWDGSRS